VWRRYLKVCLGPLCYCFQKMVLMPRHAVGAESGRGFRGVPCWGRPTG
jgi:hypothetical protein